MPPSRRRPITAAELKKEVEDRYRNDPVYKASVDRQEAEHRVRREELSRAERPLVAALQGAGIPVNSAWELYEYAELGEKAYPLLLKHLQLDYLRSHPQRHCASLHEGRRTKALAGTAQHLPHRRPAGGSGRPSRDLEPLCRSDPLRRFDRDSRERGTWRRHGSTSYGP